jgi:hypothetical protein
VAALPRRTDQILDLCAAYTGQRRRPATPLEGHPARSRRNCTQFGMSARLAADERRHQALDGIREHGDRTSPV